MPEADELDRELARDLLAIVEALQRRGALLGDDPLHDRVFEHVDRAILELEAAAAEIAAGG